MRAIVRPGADEFAPAYAAYLDRIAEGEDVLGVLAAQLDEVQARLGRIPESRGDHRYAPGKWSIKEVVGHLSDSERIFACRALRIARGDQTPLPAFDENAYAPEVEAAARTLADCLAEWGDVRRATLSLFRHLPSHAWERRGTASGRTVSARALAFIIAGHTRHHLAVVGERYLG